MKKPKNKRSHSGIDYSSLISRILAFGFVVVFAGMLLRIYLINHINSTIRDIEQKRKIEANLVNMNREIMNEIQYLSRGDRIQQIASDRLDMVTPDPETLMVVIGEIQQDEQ